MRILIISFILFSVSQINLGAQEVTASSDLSLRNYLAYELLGKVDDRFVIYRDKGFVKEIDTYNGDLEHTQYAEIVLEKKKVKVVSTIALDTCFQIHYTFSDRDSVYLVRRGYSSKVELLQHDTLLSFDKKTLKQNFTSDVSEDKSKIIFKTKDVDNKRIYYLYDLIHNKFQWIAAVVMPDEQQGRMYETSVVTDRGDFHLLFLNPRHLNTEKEKISLLSLNHTNGRQTFTLLDSPKVYLNNSVLNYDNDNNNIIVSGTYANKKGRETKGYYIYKKPPNSTFGLSLVEFAKDLSSDIRSGKKNKNDVFNDLEVIDVITRNDGGIILISEIQKEFTRRHAYAPSYSRVDNNFSRGWVDYYNEDIVIMNLNPQMDIDWVKVMYKKQFSQDDEAVFSSFFIMATPSRLRLIYNDEIKSNNTVSEYIINPKGKLARNSLLSTQYQNMKLRFKDAIQVSSSEVLVPSENAYTFNLIKIAY